MSSAGLATRGGTSTVFRGDFGGTPCVVKVADASGTSQASLDREAAVLARLCPPLAPALIGRMRTDDDRPALALEPIDGVPLSRWCGDASIARRLAVGTGLCERIAAIHARGVVHGDLSGRNVLVTADDGVRVIDFGSAALVGDDNGNRPRLATPAYLAPGAATGASAMSDDVYAAGVLLFELCTGRLPFTGTGRALRQAHEMERPPLPSRFAPVSRAIDRLVLRCLAKDPTRRFVDGEALVAAWSEAVAAGERPRFARGTRTPPTETACADRMVHAALLGFRHAVSVIEVIRVVTDHGGTVAHRAPGVCVAAWTRGAAPDRAAMAARRHLATIGCASFVDRAAPVRVDARGVLRGAAILELAASVVEGAAVDAPVVAPFIGRDGELATLRARIVDALSNRTPIAIRIEGEAGTGKSRFLHELVLAVSASAHERPRITRIAGELGDASAVALAADALAHPSAASLVVVLDDAQWIDPVAIDLLERETRTTTSRPLVVISAARPGGFDSLPRSQALGTLRLEALDEANARRLCRALVSDVLAVPARVIDHVAAFAGGVPLVLHELVRALRAGGAIHDGRVDVDVMDLHAGVGVIEWAVDRELERLGPALRGHAFLAAVLGSVIDADALAKVLAHLDEHDHGTCAPLDAQTGLTCLANHGLLVQGRGATLVFRHALVRDAVLARVPAPDRRAFAAAAFDVLGGRAGDVTRATWAELAGRDAEAIHAWDETSAAALARHDHVTVEHACDRALRLAPPTDERISELLRRRAVGRYRLGRHDAAALDFAAAAEATRASFERARLLLDEAMALDWARQFTRAGRCTEAAVALLASSEIPAGAGLRAACALAVGRTHWRSGDARAARRSLDEALAMADEIGEPAYEIAVVAGVVLGWVHAELGELEVAERVLDAAGARARAAGDRLHEAAALNNLAFVHWQRGAVDALPSIYDRVVAIGRELGMPTHEYRAACWMLEVTRATGATAAADELARRIAALEDGFPDLFPKECPCSP
jgi:predicted Ser/Thr protein kinase/tetratricopeptide (TPR) repeat protein